MSSTEQPVDSVNSDYRTLWDLRRAHASPLAFLEHHAARGDVAPFTIRRQPTFLVSHPAAIEQVLVTQGTKFAKSPALNRARRLLGSGLLTAEPPLHTERRRLMLPAFHRQRMDRYVTIMESRAREQGDTWHDGVPVDMHREMTTITLATVGDTLFTSDLRQYEVRIRRSVAMAMVILDPLVALVAPARRLRPARQRLLEVIHAIVEARLASGEVLEDLLGMLMLARTEESTTEQLYDDVLTILLAGHDTIANALTWTWMFLAEHPEVDRRLHEEATSVFDGRPLTFEDVPRLPYARAVLSESLRLRPPAWLLARRATESVDIAGTTIPANGLVLICPYLVHRDERFFDDPLAFNPERWLDGSVRNRPKLSFFPFGAGRRSCVGESFAWMEGVIVLATLATRWSVRLVNGPIDMDLRITMRPAGPMVMRPVRRG